MIFIKIFVSLLLIVVLYILVSWFLLDGKISYWTSNNGNSIKEAKSLGLFETSDLSVLSDGDSLLNWKSYFDIWTIKRIPVKYFGFAFHKKYTNEKWRYLNVKFKEGYDYELNNWCVKEPGEIYNSKCCKFYACSVGDTLLISFYNCRDNYRLGSLKIIIQ